MDYQTTTATAPEHSATMLHRATIETEGSEFSNSARDTFKFVLNYSPNSRAPVHPGAGQAAGNSREDENAVLEFNDAVNYLLNAVPPFLAGVRKNVQSPSTVGKTTGTDGGDPIPQAVTIDTPQSSLLGSDSVDVINLVPTDPASLPVTSIADRYTRSMLECLVGYPLYVPKPLSEHSAEYLCSGVNIGDVGFVRGDGVFDFLFNICPSQNSLINPHMLPEGFSLETLNHTETRDLDPLPRRTCLFPSAIAITKCGEYICEGPEGAVLELPEGAIQSEAMKLGPFTDIAKIHGVQWYEYTMARGREISNGSLYLITSFTKCTQWGIAVFNRPCAPGQGLKFDKKIPIPFRSSTSKYHWKGSRTITTKVAETNRGNAANQCVFLRGYKIMIRQDIFDKLHNDRLRKSLKTSSSSSPQAGGSSPTRHRAWRIRGGGGTDPRLTGGSLLTQITKSSVKKSDEVVLHANFNSTLVHPSDLINAALLSQNPNAKIALTHDDVWCHLLRDNFPKLDCATLINTARSYTSTVDEYGCVSIEKISDSNNVLDDNTRPLRGSETPALQELGASSVKTSRVSTPLSPVLPLTPEPPSINLSTGDAQSREAGEPYDAGRGDRVVQSEEALSIPKTSNQVVTTPNIGIDTGGGAYTVNPNFSEGGHAFGGDNIVINCMIIRFGDVQFTEIQKNLICDYIANLAVLPGIQDKLDRHVLTQLIINLPRAKAVFGDYQIKQKGGPCFEGTRVALLREMADWVIGEGESRVYVLSGLAGIGKSTVGYTIASRAADLNLLGASFFFSRDEAECKNAKKFFTTIAYQLCVYNEAFAKAIGDALLTERGSAATMKDPEEQLRALIVDPLRSIVSSRARPILVVVDALDECDDDDALSVLSGLSQLVQDLPSFKVILTSRPQPNIDHFIATREGHKIFHIQDIEDKVIDGDIRLYLKHSLSREQVRKCFPKKTWCASDEEIDYLVRGAGRLFIIAATAVRFILDKIAANPATQMQKLVHLFAQDRMPLTDLNEFYTDILRNVVPVDCDDDEIVSRYQSVVGAVIFIQSSLPVTALAYLTNIDTEELYAVLDHLQSIILLGDDDIPRVYHKSFPDYITNSKRCQDVKLHIDPMVLHSQITIRCFEIMDQHLKYNILGLGDPARFMSNENALAKDKITDVQLKEKIPQHLRYACVYWANHIKVANIEDINVMKGLEKFTDCHLLHWFEVLSLLKKLDLAHRAIRVVSKILKPTSPSDVRQLLSDGLRFIPKFYETIERSALHTYYSALPFTPTDSLLYCRYISEACHNICEINGVQERWDVLVAHLVHEEEEVQSVQFSSDSSAFVSWAKSKKGSRIHGSLKVWDGATGTPISTIRGSDFAITNDLSTLVASFEDYAIRLYRLNGSKRGTTFITQSRIRQMAISSENNRIAAGCFDGTLCLWDSENSELIESFGKVARSSGISLPIEKEYRGHLHFSATGARLAYLSHMGVVKLRDGINGRLIANLDCGSASDSKPFVVQPLSNLEFSSDASRIAYLQSTSGLTLWSCKDGELVGVARDAGTRLAISANGSLLATGDDKKVKLWSGSGNPLPLVEVLDFDPVFSMIFSGLDDTLAITTKSEIKLYNVKSHSFIFTLPFFVSYNTPVAFSLDGTRLAAGNSGGSVYLWDIKGIETSGPSSNEQASNEITALAFSRDCTRVACGFEDGAIELWEISDLEKRRIAAHRHHSVQITTIRFSPDDRRFASGSDNGTINLWDSECGILLGALKYPMPGSDARLLAMEVSNNVLAALGDKSIALWDPITLDHIHTFEGSFQAPLSFSANGKYLAAIVRSNLDPFYYRHRVGPGYNVHVFDVTKRINVAILHIPPSSTVRAMAFLPDNSRLVLFNHDFLLRNHITYNIFSEKDAQQPTLEFGDIIQLRNIPVWHGVPIWLNKEGEQYYLWANFPQHDDSVPVLWLPRELRLQAWAHGRFMIALGCANGRILLLRPYTNLCG